jgi:hypothetical protein
MMTVKLETAKPERRVVTVGEAAAILQISRGAASGGKDKATSHHSHRSPPACADCGA